MFITNTPSEAEWAALDKSDHSSRALSVLVINGIFLGLVVVVIGLRLFTKIFMTAKLFLDDYLMTSAALLFTAFCVVNMRAVHFGFGGHAWDLAGITDSSTLTQLSDAAAPVQMLNYVALILVSPAIILGKLSVLVILLRVFPASMRVLRVFLVAMAVLLTLCCVTQALLVAFQCSPIQASWNVWGAEEGGEKACYIEPLQAVTMALGAVNVVTDLAICVTPIPYFWRLNVSRAQKLCLCALFASGLVACAVSIIRLASLTGLNDNIDVTYVAVPYFSWTVIETALVIITGSLPFLRPLLATILPDFFSAHNFSCLFASSALFHASHSKSAGRKKSDLSAASSSSSSSRSGRRGALSSSKGDVTITTEFHLEELADHKADGSDGGFDARPPGTPSTPLAPRSGFRMHVTCERSRGYGEDRV